MNLTINHMCNYLFNKGSIYCNCINKNSETSYDPFVVFIFEFLDRNEETKKAYEKLLEGDSSYLNFCNGKLRSDGYYPLRSINEFIYTDLIKNYRDPDNSLTIQELSKSYEILKNNFNKELNRDNPVFTNLLSLENCMKHNPLYSYLQNALSNEKFCLVLAWMTVIAVFPSITSVTEKKPDYTQMLWKRLFENQFSASTSLHNAYETFLNEQLAVDDSIEEIVIVHNHGLRELTERTALLEKLIERAKCVRILITEYVTSENFTQHVRDNSKFFLSRYMKPELMWNDFCSQYQDKILFHLSHIPAIHQYTEVIFLNPNNSCSFVGFYTYGSDSLDASPFMIIPHNAPYYSNFRNEFEYMWELSTQYKC